MNRQKVIWVVSIIVAGIAVAYASFLYGLRAQYTELNRSLAHVQATLAFAHYKGYQRLESLLMRKCYDAALTQARGLINEQLRLLADNLRETGNDPELVEYIKLRDAKALEIVLTGRVPEAKPYTTYCP
jgi:hypothetical protein